MLKSSSVHWAKTELELLLNSPLNFFELSSKSIQREWSAPAKKEKELQNFVCHGKEKAQFPLFSTRGHSTLSELTLNSVQKSSMVRTAHISNIRMLEPTFVGVKKKVTFVIKTF